MPDVHPDAHALTLFRVSRGEGIEYTATTFPADPWQGCEHTIRTAWAVGYLRDVYEGDYAVLDVLNEDGDIVQDYSIPSARAFQWLKRRLGIAVDRDAAAITRERRSAAQGQEDAPV